MALGSAETREELEAHIAHRAKADAFFTNLMPSFKMDQEVVIQDYDCYRFLINSYESMCEPLSDYSGKYAKVLGHACNTYSEFQLSGMIKQMDSLC